MFKGTDFYLPLSFFNYRCSYKLDNSLTDSLALSYGQKYLSENKILNFASWCIIIKFK
jgi:hypothetical protein